MESTQRGQVVAIASGKGGVGKSNLAVNLGIQLSRRGSRVVLVDADFGLANADVLLDVSPVADITALLDESCSLGDVLVEGPEGLRVVCGTSVVGPDGQSRSLSTDECIRALERIDHACDCVVIDCGSGISDSVITFSLACDRLLLVTTPEPPAVADAYATLKLLDQRGFTGMCGVVVNLSRSERQARATTRRLQRVAAQFLGRKIEDFGHIPRDSHVVRAVQQRQPVSVRYPRCGASVCIYMISCRLDPAGGTQKPAATTWGRVANLFL